MATREADIPLSRDTVMGELQAYGTASQQLNTWIAGEQALGLLRAAHAAGILAATETPRTTNEIARVTGLDSQRAADILYALNAHGVVKREGEAYHLAANFALLLAPTAFQTLPDLLARSAMMAGVLEASVAPDHAYTVLSAQDALVLARGAAPNPLSPVFVAYMGMVAAQLPELRARWDAGARHIEFGCGAGGGLLGFVAAHLRLTAVGVEIHGTVLAEARRRAEAVGIADRVELRHADALDGAEADTYDSAFWAQQFFAAASRPAMYAVVMRTLKPGGFLILPTFVPSEPPASEEALHTPAGQAYALSRIRFGHWGVPALTADELHAEAEAAGFAFVRRAPFSTSFLLLFQRPV